MENHHLTALLQHPKDGPHLIAKLEDSVTPSSDSQVLDEDRNRNNQLSAKSKIIKKSSDSKKKYDNISNELRLKLIDAVETKGQKIKLAAKLLGINYSSAKSICQIFKREGRSNKKIFKKKGPKEDGLNNISLDISKNRVYNSKSTEQTPLSKSLQSDVSLTSTKNVSLQNLEKQASSEDHSDLYAKKALNNYKLELGADRNLKALKDTYSSFPNPFKMPKDGANFTNGHSFNTTKQNNIKGVNPSDIMPSLSNFAIPQNNPFSLPNQDTVNLINNMYTQKNGMHNPLLQNGILGLSGLAKNTEPNILGLSQMNNLPYPNILELMNSKESAGMNLNTLYHQSLLRPELQYPAMLKQNFLNNNLSALQAPNSGLLMSAHNNLASLNMLHQMGGYPNLDLLQNPNLLQLQATQQLLQPTLNKEKK